MREGVHSSSDVLSGFARGAVRPELVLSRILGVGLGTVLTDYRWYLQSLDASERIREVTTQSIDRMLKVRN